jgi:hypothetical protein
MRLCLFAVTLVAFLSGLQRIEADLVYEFSGTLPTTGLTGSYAGITAGETWKLQVTIDTSVIDNDSSSAVGNYPNAIIGAHISFENGVSRTFGPGGGGSDHRDIVIHDDFEIDSTTARDMVSASVRDSSPYRLVRVRAMTFGEPPRLPLTSDALPLTDTSFTASPDPAPGIDPEEQVFFFGDEMGSISYTTATANNVTFTTAPEPASISLALAMGLFLLAWYGRSRWLRLR